MTYRWVDHTAELELHVEAPTQELVFLVESEAVVLDALGDLHVADGRVRATVRARPGSSPPLVKAVTYHRLAFDQAGDGYRATVVLDV